MSQQNLADVKYKIKDFKVYKLKDVEVSLQIFLNFKTVEVVFVYAGVWSIYLVEKAGNVNDSLTE